MGYLKNGIATVGVHLEKKIGETLFWINLKWMKGLNVKNKICYSPWRKERRIPLYV